MRILLVEDDAEIAAMLRQVLESAGFTLDLAQDGRVGLRAALQRDYGLIVLDVMLPGLDGMQVCAELRARRRTTPVLMLTARYSVGDRIRGLETGADDYLTKPFDVREFIARVGALLRRDRVLKTRNLTVGELRIDTARKAVAVGGKALSLTRTEYALLELLASKVGRVVFRETLLEIVWEDREPGSNKLDVAVRSLRRKLEAAGSADLIQTMYGMGYMIADGRETS